MRYQIISNVWRYFTSFAGHKVNKCEQLIFIVIIWHDGEIFWLLLYSLHIHGFGLKYGWFPEFLRICIAKK